MECDYDPDKCPECGYSMKHDGTHEEECNNPKCGFVFNHCGDCDEEFDPPESHGSEIGGDREGSSGSYSIYE